jgi:hypothetical protein
MCECIGSFHDRWKLPEACEQETSYYLVHGAVVAEEQVSGLSAVSVLSAASLSFTRAHSPNFPDDCGSRLKRVLTVLLIIETQSVVAELLSTYLDETLAQRRALRSLKKSRR